jgi:hypothetical protein
VETGSYLRQFLATLRVFVVGKNYRLQDIQLLKSRLKLPAVSSQLPARGGRLRDSFSPNFFGFGQERFRSTDRFPSYGSCSHPCKQSRCLTFRLSLTSRLLLRAARLGHRAPAERKCRRHLQTKVGEYRARTGDLLVANQALSQLS